MSKRAKFLVAACGTSNDRNTEKNTCDSKSASHVEFPPQSKQSPNDKVQEWLNNVEPKQRNETPYKRKREETRNQLMSSCQKSCDLSKNPDDAVTAVCKKLNTGRNYIELNKAESKKHGNPISCSNNVRADERCKGKNIRKNLFSSVSNKAIKKSQLPVESSRSSTVPKDEGLVEKPKSKEKEIPSKILKSPGDKRKGKNVRKRLFSTLSIQSRAEENVACVEEFTLAASPKKKVWLTGLYQKLTK